MVHNFSQKNSFTGWNLETKMQASLALILRASSYVGDMLLEKDKTFSFYNFHCQKRSARKRLKVNLRSAMFMEKQRPGTSRALKSY